MALVGVDWGSTSLRAYLIESPGAILESVEAPGDGTLALSTGGPDAFVNALQALLQKGASPAWLSQRTPVLLIGMVGSTKGWLEAPYAEIPASAEDLAAKCPSVRLKDGREARIIPGLCYRPASGAAPDVMRGEETQLLGAWAGKSRLFVLPGTHSKWALTSADGVVSFQTQMTGELFELLRQHSILRTSIEEGPEDWTAFQAGLSRSGQPGGILAHAFTVRTEGLASTMTPKALASYLSGVLIGHEVRAGIAAWFSADCGGVTLVGSLALCERYRRAFAFLHGIEAGVVPGQDAVAQGLWRLRQCMQRNHGEAIARERWQASLSACPVVAILRGIKPEEAIDVGKALVDAGITIIEVPTNSPNAFESIRLLVQHLPSNIVVGAGTCLTAEHVEQVAAAGATLVVSPNVEEEVIRRSKALGLICLPGVATPTEAFAALAFGATGLKAFPGEQVPPQILKAWKAVLPTDVTLLVVGGVAVDNARTYWDVGISGFGIGSAIYKPGMSAKQAQTNAESFVSCIHELRTEQSH